MSEYNWAYKCSICGDEVDPDDVRKHTEEERAKDTWPGFMSWSRVDK